MLKVFIVEVVNFKNGTTHFEGKQGAWGNQLASVNNPFSAKNAAAAHANKINNRHRSTGKIKATVLEIILEAVNVHRHEKHIPSTTY